jgi:adenylate kinase family enzyme
MAAIILRIEKLSKIYIDMDIPIIKTKIEGLEEKFNLTDPKSRAEYFQAKVANDLETIKGFLENHQFTAYFLGKKNSGKGTYSKLLSEAVGSDKIVHVSVGDLVRDVSASWDEYKNSPKYNKLKAIYRGFMSLEEAEEALASRSQSKLLPTEFILALLKIHLEDMKDKSIFVDGFPREDDQLAYTLFLKDIVNRPDSKDLFILIDIPDSILDERIKHRVICPLCKTPRNTKLLATTKVGYDQESKEFYLMCDNPECNSGARMVKKEGDEQGVGPIQDRLNKDQQILEKVYDLYGLPKILLRNAIPVDQAKENFDDYEITPGYDYELEEDNQVKVIESPWKVKDNQGIDSYSLLPGPVVLALIKQLAEILK